MCILLVQVDLQIALHCNKQEQRCAETHQQSNHQGKPERRGEQQDQNTC